MAAPSNKPSPTNRPMEGATDTTSDAAASAAVTSVAAKPVAAPADTNASAETQFTDAAPTYESVESSDVYLLAKRHLNDGNFEDAMTVIEEGIRDTQEILKKVNDCPDGDFSLHESMAPFHYLYGTTLLYSIEESDQEVTTAGSAVSAAVVSGEQAAMPGVAAAARPDDDQGQEEQDDNNAQTTAADVADDMEIAWENLEAARQIMEQMFTSNTKNEMSEKLELDLAQIYLREGDLQRINGRYEAAISDYQSCLRLRKKSKFLGTFDRKVADVHYNLGLVYITLGSLDEVSGDADDEGEAKPKISAADEEVKKAKRIMARNKSVYHYLECAKCFSGQIASICNANAKDINNVAIDDEDNVVGARQKVPAFKTTGEEDDEMELPAVASAKLQTLRKRAAEVASFAELTGDQKLDVEDLIQLLDDIQETVDEAENSTQGVQEISNMKAQVAALAAADGEPGESKAEGGATTTIGFGDAAAATASGTTTIGFGSAAAASSAGVAAAAAPTAGTPARPMMVVKKKKRPAEDGEKQIAKMPKPDSE